MKSRIWALFSVFLLSLNAGCVVHSNGWNWDGSEDVVRKTFEVSPGGLLTVDADLGAIEVNTTEGNRVDVEVIRKVNARDRERVERILEDLDLSISQNGNNVDVRADLHRGGSWWNVSRRIRLEFRITVPKVYNVDLKTAGGSISVDDLKGRAEAKTSGGSLHFGAIEGPVTGRTSGGSINLAGCTGIADVRTSGGSIEIGDVDGEVTAETSGGSVSISRAKGRVSAGTSGGGIHVDEVWGEINAHTSGGSVFATIAEQPKGDCRLSTSGGGVEVRLADNLAVDLDAKTSGGRVRVDMPVTVQGEIGKSSVQGTINGGGPALVLRTSGGNIEVLRSSQPRAER